MSRTLPSAGGKQPHNRLPPLNEYPNDQQTGTFRNLGRPYSIQFQQSNNRDNRTLGPGQERAPFDQMTKTGGVLNLQFEEEDRLNQDDLFGEQPQQLEMQFDDISGKTANIYFKQSLQTGKFKRIKQKEKYQETMMKEQAPIDARPVSIQQNFEEQMKGALRKCTICLQKFFTFFIGTILGISAIQLFILIELSSQSYSQMVIQMSILLYFFFALNAIGSANFLIIRLQQDKFNEQEGHFNPVSKQLKFLAWVMTICSVIAFIITLYEPIAATKLGYKDPSKNTLDLLVVSIVRFVLMCISWLLTILGLEWSQETIDFPDIEQETDVGDGQQFDL